MNSSNRINPLLRHFVQIAVAAWLAVGQVRAEPTPIPVEQIGAVAGKHYLGEGLSVKGTPYGATLRCDFQRLTGEVNGEGLWLSSGRANPVGERFRILAVAVGRETDASRSPSFLTGEPLDPSWTAGPLRVALSETGSVTVAGPLIRFIRTGLTEEYSVSVDGVRQDFVVEQAPAGEGPLRVELGLTGAEAELSPSGARLVLAGTGRQLAYGRLRVVDALGQRLAARLEVTGATRLAVVVADAAAVYPVRIDPTVSDDDWGSVGGLLGTDDFVNAVVADQVGNLYVGGYFRQAGDLVVNHIARWDGSEWSSLGSGLDGGVWALAVSGTDLYVGGDFTWADESELGGGIPVNRVAKWNGSEWSALGAGLGAEGEPGLGSDDYVTAIAVLGNDVYAGGYFHTSGGTAVTNIARWNGTAWSAVGLGLDDGVHALATIGSDLYAGGGFTREGGSPADFIARWDGSAWSALGAGVDDWVYALGVRGTDLYVGGEFAEAGGQPAQSIARWNGSTWSPLGEGVGGRVTALAVSGTELFVGGQFNTVGDESSAYYVARWNGSAWSALGNGVDDYVSALAVVGGTLYVGGDFEFVGGNADGEGQKVATFVARWNGSDWSALGSGITGQVLAVAAVGTDLYVGGYFTTAALNPARNVARWDGSDWLAVGSGTDQLVSVLTAVGTHLYAGGDFLTAGGIPARHIARWDGSAWSALGTGLDGPVWSMAAAGTDLYVGGDFLTANANALGEGIPTRRIARWDGTAWSPLGAGVNASVLALAVIGGDVFAGGAFTEAGGVEVISIARWNGTEWSALGSGVNSQVYALASLGTDLYVGGNFTEAGGISAQGIARWDGSGWSPLGSGVDGSVFAIAASSPDLYVGGTFGMAGATEVGNLAQWNGSEWRALGTGVNDACQALAVVGSELYAGGKFISAGNKAARYVARASLAVNTSPSLTLRESDGTLTLSWRSPAPGFVVQHTTDLKSPVWLAAPETVTDDGSTRSIRVGPMATLRFFRLYRP